MNARDKVSSSPRLALWLKSATGPRDPVRVMRALVSLASSLPLNLEISSTSRTPPAKQAGRTSYRGDALIEDARDPATYRSHLYSKSPDECDAMIFLRPFELEVCHVSTCQLELIFPLLGTDAGATGMASLTTFIKETASEYSITQGLLAQFPSYALAKSEVDVAFRQSHIDLALQVRQRADSQARSQFATKLRRLYPVTIIGNAIWDRLPPMPAVSPAPEVRDLGSCKMLIAWPELVSPYDPAFLAGTRELRQWLWPHTIQNPYDKLDLDV